MIALCGEYIDEISLLACDSWNVVFESLARLASLLTGVRIAS